MSSCSNHHYVYLPSLKIKTCEPRMIQRHTIYSNTITSANILIQAYTNNTKISSMVYAIISLEIATTQTIHSSNSASHFY